MASMKDYLEKAMLRLGSRGAMPGTQIIQYSVNEFVAPDDGYVVAGSESGEVGEAVAARGAIFQSISRSPISVASLEAFIPCKKGETVSVYFGSKSKILKRFFLKSVGGGLKRLIQKAFCLGGRYGFA